MKFTSVKQQAKVMMQFRSIQSPPFRSANRLPVRVGLIVPSTQLDRKIKPHSFTKRVNSEKRWFDDKFGGDTSVEEIGSYSADINGKKKLIKERVVMVVSRTTPEQYAASRRTFARHVEARQRQWKQQTMYAEVDGRAYIVPKQSFIATDTKTPSRIAIP